MNIYTFRESSSALSFNFASLDIGRRCVYVCLCVCVLGGIGVVVGVSVLTGNNLLLHSCIYLGTLLHSNER